MEVDDMSVVLNGVTYTQGIKTGYDFNDYANDTLGGGTLILSHQPELDIKPFDTCIVDGVYRLVNSYRRTIASHSSPKLYNYEIKTVSPEIKLQRIVLPNRSITQPLGETPRTIWYYLTKYVSMYASGYTLDSSMSTVLNATICPEMQWAQPTLFEVINDLMDVVGWTLKMTSLTAISYLDRNARGTEITGIHNEEVTHDANEYARELDIDLKNTIPDFINARSFQAPKTLTGALLTTNDGELIFEDNIEDMETLTARYLDEIGGVTNMCTVGIDISHIVEESVYNLMKPSNTPTTISGDFKRDKLYYKRGENRLRGLYYHDDAWFPSISSDRAIINIFKNSTPSCVPLTGSDSYSQLRDMWFWATFKSQTDMKVRVYKDGMPSNSAAGAMINNQEESHVSHAKFSKGQRELLERIGNASMIIYGRYDTVGDIPDLLDTYEGYVLVSRTWVKHEDWVDFTGILASEYVMENLYQGLNAQKRYTEYASSSEAFYSNHVRKLRYFFSKTLDAGPTDLFCDYTVSKYQNNPSDEYAPQLPYYVFRTYNNSDVAISGYIRKYGTAWRHNRSILYHMQMFDNIASGINVESDYTLNYEKYVDDLGEFVKYKVWLIEGETYISDFIATPTTVAGVLSQVNSIRSETSAVAITGGLEDNYPKIFESDLVTRWKDNREITAETLEFRFLSSDEVVVTDEFIRRHPMVREVSEARPTFKLFISTTQKYDKYSIIGVGTEYDNTNITILDNTITCSVSLVGAVSWGITDITGKLLIGVNITSSSQNIIRLYGSVEE